MTVKKMGNIYTNIETVKIRKKWKTLYDFFRPGKWVE